jgi:hypothetical protein
MCNCKLITQNQLDYITVKLLWFIIIPHKFVYDHVKTLYCTFLNSTITGFQVNLSVFLDVITIINVTITCSLFVVFSMKTLIGSFLKMLAVEIQ